VGAAAGGGGGGWRLAAVLGTRDLGSRGEDDWLTAGEKRRMIPSAPRESERGRPLTAAALVASSATATSYDPHGPSFLHGISATTPRLLSTQGKIFLSVR